MGGDGRGGDGRGGEEGRGGEGREGVVDHSRILKVPFHNLCVRTGSSVLYFNVCPTSVFQITHI